MTADQAIGRDANEFFQKHVHRQPGGQISPPVVAPTSLKSPCWREMDREIAKGPEGRILIKINSITDYGLIEKLKGGLLRRGCRFDDSGHLLPAARAARKDREHPHHQHCGRFLEHSRIYCSGQGKSGSGWDIASADFRRPATPSAGWRGLTHLRPVGARKNHQILDACSHGCQMRRDGSYCRCPRSPSDSQRVSSWSRPSGDAKEEQFA